MPDYTAFIELKVMLAFRQTDSNNVCPYLGDLWRQLGY